MEREHVIAIKNAEGSIPIGVSAAGAAEILGVRKQGIQRILGSVGILPLTKSPGLYLYDPKVIERYRDLREEYPPVSGRKYDPPQELLDKYNLP